MSDETTHYGLLKTLGENPGLSRRDLTAKGLGRLGKIKVLNGLIEKDSLKIGNFGITKQTLFMPVHAHRGVERSATKSVSASWSRDR